MENQNLDASIYYEKIIKHNAFVFDHIVNDKGQHITFYEHPIYGDSSPIIVAFPEYKLAFDSDFYDLEDMTHGKHNEYKPYLVDGDLVFGYELT